MPLEAVIFDLDLTLISSSSAESLRKQRAWSEVYKLIPKLGPYEGVSALIATLNEQRIKTAIVTSSPGSYCSRVVKQWAWSISTTVCYHDTKEKKPHPAPIIRALENLHVSANNAIAVGDAPADIASAKAAKVFAVAALWGIAEHSALVSSEPDLVCATVHELAQFIESKL